MTHVGIDLEQFVTDPYGSGIQRVLQQLAIHWPGDVVTADFVVPHNGEYLLLAPEQAAALVGEAFTAGSTSELRTRVQQHVNEWALQVPQVGLGDLLATHSAWLLPEVSYLPSVLNRFKIFEAVMPSTMIGFDALPMTDPVNYRFLPGQSGPVSEYFRMLASCDRVVCISEYAREALWTRLRRPRNFITNVVSPGGDHVEVGNTPSEGESVDFENPIRLLRVGTLEDRKRPLEILEAFVVAREKGLAAELVFAGAPSASNPSINNTVERAVAADIGVTWLVDASDQDIHRLMRQADVFLSLGTEGFGIPVLESLALGTPVVAGGIQPAGMLMSDHGVLMLQDDSSESLLAFLLHESLPNQLMELRQNISTANMPTWSNFAREVAETVLP